MRLLFGADLARVLAEGTARRASSAASVSGRLLGRRLVCGFVRCVADGDGTGEVGYRGLDERWPCRGGAAGLAEEGCGEGRGVSERCRADPGDLREVGREP